MTTTAPTSAPDVDAETLARYADLVVGFAANVQRGQVVELRSALGREGLTRAIADSCYRRGARFVDASYLDPWLRRSRVAHADGETLDFVPEWHRERVLAYGRDRCARIAVGGLVGAGLLDDLDPERAARDRWPFIPEYHRIIDDRTTNWTGVNTVTDEWASVVYPDLEHHEAVARLWADVVHICRLDEPDPVAAWSERLALLERVSACLNELRLDAVRLHGPATDLTVGLLPSSRWKSGFSQTVAGISFVANLPTEEAFTAPDPQRADGEVRATRPLVLRNGTVVEGLRVRFRGGRAVAIDADRNAAALRNQCGRDPGGGLLGELALVDGESRVGRRGTVFYDTLYDENAASHLALGSAYRECVGDEDAERANESSIHIDFMVGSEEVDVDGVTRDGREVAILRGGAWQLF